MEPNSINPVEEIYNEPTSLDETLGIPTTKSIENNSPNEPMNKENTLWIWIFLIILIILCAILGFVGYNYQIPVETINTPITSEIPVVNRNIEPIVPQTNIPQETSHIDTPTENGTTLSIDPIKVENPEKKVIESSCLDGSCNTKCSEASIWNGVRCQELNTLKVTENVAPSIPDNHIIFAAGGYNGKKINQYIDDSGKEAGVYEVSVDYTEKPVVLILGAYEPSIWNIRISQGTRIEKIILGGYYNQVVTGIFKTIPIERHIYTESKTNDYFYISKGETTKGSLKRFGDIETISYGDENGTILIGNTPTTKTLWIQDPQNTAEAYYKKGDELGGKAGLDLLVQKGAIRVATKADADKWFDGLISSPKGFISKKEGFPITDPSDLEILRKKYTPGFGEYGGSYYYVALKDFKLPGGMYWAFAFYIPEGITVTGDISNGSLYHFETMECKGACMETRR